jgi:hypothetical protein
MSKKEIIEIIEKTKFITQFVGNLSITERREIYHMITNSSMEIEKIKEKGSGIQIRYRDIPPTTVIDIYNYIKEKIDEKTETLKNHTEENTELSDVEA